MSKRQDAALAGQKICATCRRPLRSIRQPGATVTEWEHVTPEDDAACASLVPIDRPTDDSKISQVCDFCSAKPIVEIFTPVKGAVAAGLLDQDDNLAYEFDKLDSPWSACAVCAGFVHEADMDALKQRAENGEPGQRVSVPMLRIGMFPVWDVMFLTFPEWGDYLRSRPMPVLAAVIDTDGGPRAGLVFPAELRGMVKGTDAQLTALLGPPGQPSKNVVVISNGTEFKVSGLPFDLAPVKIHDPAWAEAARTDQSVSLYVADHRVPVLTDLSGDDIVASRVTGVATYHEIEGANLDGDGDMGIDYTIPWNIVIEPRMLPKAIADITETALKIDQIRNQSMLPEIMFKVRDTLNHDRLWWLSRESTDMVATLAAGAEQVDLAELDSRSGFMYFEGGIPSLYSDAAFDAISWGRSSRDGTFQVVLWCHRTRYRFKTDYETKIVPATTGTLPETIHTTRGDLTHGARAGGAILAILGSAFTAMRTSSYIAQSTVAAPKAHKKQTRKKGGPAGPERPLPEVRLVNVDRPANPRRVEKDKSGRVYQHQWWVEPHRRNQAYGPKRGQRKWIVVDAYIKGPAGSPMMPRKPKVNVWRAEHTPTSKETETDG